MKNINTVRKLAWQFHKSSGLDFQELMSEGTLAYYEALKAYDKNYKWKSNKNTLIYVHVFNKLILFIRYEKRYVYDGFIIDRSSHPTPFFEIEEQFDKDGKEIIQLILSNKHAFAGIPGKYARGKLIEMLRQQGWSWSKIWDSIRNIKFILNEIPENCIIY